MPLHTVIVDEWDIEKLPSLMGPSLTVDVESFIKLKGARVTLLTPDRFIFMPVGTVHGVVTCGAKVQCSLHLRSPIASKLPYNKVQERCVYSAIADVLP